MTIDEAAEALGVELLPWQREAGQRILDGEQVVMAGGRQAGRATLRRVLARASAPPASRDTAPQTLPPTTETG